MKSMDCNYPTLINQDIITQDLALVSWIWVKPQDSDVSSNSANSAPAQSLNPPNSSLDPLRPLRHWLDNIEVCNVNFAHQLCTLIPAQCPFERTIKLFNRTILHIPPLCKLNPLYEEVVALRFRALCYLADECGEDVTRYC